MVTQPGNFKKNMSEQTEIPTINIVHGTKNPTDTVPTWGASH